MEKAIINKIIPFSAVDGPGNRIAIFFQQCNFTCSYCHNPETINLCVNCGDCVKVCPKKAITLVDGKIQWDQSLCIDCDSCIAVCKYLSTPKTKLMSVHEVVDIVKKSMPFTRGITVSGGECTLNPLFLTNLFRQIKALKLSTMIDSNGSYDFSQDEELLAYTDGVMLDIKAFNHYAHKYLTGKGNENVLKNALYLAKKQKLYEVRTVIVSDYLPNEHTVKEVAELLKPFAKKNDIKYKLIRYQPNGVRKEYENFKVPDDNQMQHLKNIVLSNGWENVIIS